MLNFKEWFTHHHEDNVHVGGITPKYYTNPYLIGLLLGLVLLSAFVTMGRGLGSIESVKHGCSSWSSCYIARCNSK